MIPNESPSVTQQGESAPKIKVLFAKSWAILLSVLVLVQVELIFFTVPGIELCFGFVLEMVLIT